MTEKSRRRSGWSIEKKKRIEQRERAEDEKILRENE